MINLRDKLKVLPQKPGVYWMMDSLENIIYVGKAKNLKNRVTQYFTHQKDRASKIVEMINNISTFEFMITDTELDAFIEECRLIKEIKPRYNSQMKNDQKYLFIRIPNEQFPKIMLVHSKANDKALYYGPFSSRNRVERAIQYLNDIFTLRKCSTSGLMRRANGCLYHQLGTCLGVCTGQVSPLEYGQLIEKMDQVLTGKDKSVVNDLTRKIETAITELNFEKAAQFREFENGLRHVLRKQQLIQSSNRNRNIVAVEWMNSTQAKMFLIKGNLLLHRMVYNLELTDRTELKEELKQTLNESFVNLEMNLSLRQDNIDEAQIIYSYLKRNKNTIHSFWIPASHLKRNSELLDLKISRIVNQLWEERFESKIKTHVG